MKMWTQLVIPLLLIVVQSGSTATLTSLYSFGSQPTDGSHPAELAQGSDDNFYGTTPGGGANGFGTVFRISPSGSFSNLYSFSGGSAGANPRDGLVQGSDGDFYGTTSGGGAGTVFRISPSGTYTNLYSFSGYPSDGSEPNGRLVRGSDGNFYGTTPGGGASGFGTVFRISPSGSFSNLYSFSGYPSDGSEPNDGLVRGSDGNFYGTTFGGEASGFGTVFRISPSGSFSNLYSFTGGSDGGYPAAGLVQGSDGNFYGTTLGGGAGTVFRITPSGSFTNLYSLSLDFSEGYSPKKLVQGSDGNFYGTTYWGGASDYGTVFRFSVPLNPPANQISGIQLVSTDVVLTIPSVAGETYQLQFSDSLTDGSWSNVDGASITNSIGALMTLTNFGGALQPQRFYRFSITP